MTLSPPAPADIPEVMRLERLPGYAFIGRWAADEREIMAWTFETMPANAFWLDVHVENARARRVYEREGFTRDGAFDAVHQRMVIPRGRWTELRGR